MATTATPSPAVTDEARLIERQLNVTRSQVRLVELGGAAVAWLVGLLVFLLAEILVDHWLMPLGSIGRTLALLTLIGGSAAYFATIIWPLLRRQINPVYAARAIEESTPSLKNSLINFLLLKKDSSGTKEAILSAVEKRAAIDIAAVPVEMAVDRSHVIRLGYALLAVVCLFALYKIRSPKDPFQTVARVFAPWASIAQPARVAIRDITPGDVRVYHGDVVTVSCSISGLRDGEPVQVSYSTTDGQVLNQLVTMKPSSGGTRFEAQIPAHAAERNVAARGVQQDLVYQVRAGDSVTSEYRVSVSSAPAIAVERIVYDYPAYTRKSPRTVLGQGDIQGLEGTRITLQARANQPIQAATLEFDPGDGTKPPAESLPMKFEGEVATVSFSLQLSPDRQSPWRSTYQIRFYNNEGSRNPQPIVHRLDVTADMPPEIEWLTPEQMKIEVPADGQQRLELRAVDPDFGLRAIRLQALRGDQQLIDKSLLPAQPMFPPQATVRFDFVPSEFQLEDGDEIVLWGTAEDGRISAVKQAPEPNMAQTEKLLIRITAPAAADGNAGQPKQPNSANKPNSPQSPKDPQADPQQPPKQPKPGQNDPQQPPPEKNQPKPGEQPPKQPKPGEKKPDQNAGASDEQPKDSPKNKKPEQPEDSPQNGGDEGEEGKQGGSKKGDQQEPMAGEKGDEKEQGGGSQSGEQSGAPQSGGSGGGQEGGSSSGEPMNNGNQGGDAQQGGSEGGSSAEGGEGSGQDSGNSSASKQSGQNGGKQPQSGGEAGKGDPAGGESQGNPSGAPNSSNSGEGGAAERSTKPEHDGDVFDKLLDRLKDDPRNPKNPKNNNAQGKPAGERPAGDQRPQDGKAEQGESRPPQAGEQGSNSPSGNNQQGSGQPQGKPQNNGGKPGQPQEGSAKPDEQGKNGENGPGEEAKQQPQTPPNAQPGNSGNQGAGNSAQNKPGQPNGAGAQQSPETKNEGAAKEPGEKGEGTGSKQKPDLEEKKHGDGDQQTANPGEGGATQRNPRPPTDNPQRQGGQSGQPKDPGAGDNSQSGQGQNSQSKEGTANDQNDQQRQDRPKTGSADNGDGKQGETSPPGNSKKSSNSKGGESGDQNGGGKEGAGQSAGGAGNSSAGKNSAADQGAGKADEQGEGETGTKGGTQEKAEQKTGQSSGNQQGEGTESGKPPSGEKGQPGQSKDPGQGSPTDKTPNSMNGGNGGEGGNCGHVVGGGKSAEGGNANQSPAPAGEVADGDAANLDYARRATDLVIDHLEDQIHNPDPELLKELGWTKDDLEKFVQRWKSLKESAPEKAGDKKELDESLRSLGLRPPKDKQRSGGAADDHQRDVRDTGGRTSPPNRYRDQFEAFRKGVGR